MTDAHLFEDSFTLGSIIDDSYDRVARLQATNTESTIALTLDYNTELFPLESGQTVNVLFASTLNLDGTKEDLSRGWQPKRVGAEQTLADLWDYVCYGKVYRHEEMGEGGNIKVYISFGGLLACLDGPYKKLSPLRIDNVYLLMKR